MTIRGDQRLAFRREGAGPPLVMIHGYLGGAGMWSAEIESFSRSYDVIAPELAGFGESARLPGPERIESHAEQVLALLDDLDVAQFHVVGHSMGGMVVQHLAALAGSRITKMVLYGTGPGGGLADRFETPEMSRLSLVENGVAATARRIAATWFVQGERATAYEKCTVIGASASFQGAVAGTYAFERWNSLDALSSLKPPTLIVWGERDRSVSWQQVEALWRGIPDSALAVCPNCAHNVHQEKPDLYHVLLEDFLNF